MIHTICHAIDQWGITDPDRIVYREQVSHTYGELKTSSDQVANYLYQQGIRNQTVVVYGNLEFDMVAVFLGISKSGNAYIPIDAHTPLERIALILEVAQPALVIAVADWQGPAIGCPIIEQKELSQLLRGRVPAASWQPVIANENYYIIFTSGTTGVPKGVQISHDNLLSFVNWMLADFDLPSVGNYLAQAPYSFDLSVMNLYPALVSGSSLTPLSKDVTENFKELFLLLPTLAINVWVSTPSFIEICLMAPEFTSQQLPSLTHFLFCGEELTKKTATTLLERFPQAKIFNTYGPTEATVAVSEIQVRADVLASYPRVPIGYPKADTKVLILEDMQEVPEGEVGEIVIVGASVSKGYLNNAEKTQAAFFHWEGLPAYRTGDAGRITAAGLLLYEGRLDFQVKLHGYRMELEDIDHHLNRVSYVKQAITVPKFYQNKVQKLVAFVVPEPNPFAKEFQLSKAIKEELAEGVMSYMIPQKLVFVDQLPRTSNGKIDRKRLINEVNPT